MCGRFENTSSLQYLLEFIDSEQGESGIENLNQNNISPTNKILTLIHVNGNYNIIQMNWGIKFENTSPLIFNSRIETIKEKPYWFRIFDNSRCLVPMTAFYEWQTEGKRKIPYKIFLPDEKFFFVPALFVKRDDDYYASLITTVPNEFIQKIHHRMPVILRPAYALEYLTGKAGDNINKCIPYNERMEMEKVNL